MEKGNSTYSISIRNDIYFRCKNIKINSKFRDTVIWFSEKGTRIYLSKINFQFINKLIAQLWVAYYEVLCRLRTSQHITVITGILSA